MTVERIKGRRELRSRGARPTPVHAKIVDRISDAPKPRYHAFDGLRGMAMFLVVGLHAALGYVTREIPGVLWCVRDAPTTPVIDWFCWWSMGVSNPLYFTIAGFFAALLYETRGLRKFLENRAKRVAVPFLVAVPTVLPACLLAWVYGWLVSGRCTWRQAIRLRFRDPALRSEQFGTAHLWFLEYLIVMLVAFGLFQWWLQRRRTDPTTLRSFTSLVLGSRWRPFVLAVPTTVLLWISRQHVGIDAVLDRHNSFFIDPIKLLHHASFFLVGVGLYSLRADLERLARPAPWYLAMSVPIFVGRAWLLGRDRVAPLHGADALALAVLGALFAWLIVFGAIGAAHRIFRHANPTLSYLADSSYWIYLVHMPVLGLIQGDLYLIPGHAVWKMPVTLLGTLSIGFASYHSLVRYGAIGTWLHGRRERPVLDSSEPGSGLFARSFSPRRRQLRASHQKSQI
ncbi:Surface polysaccharide O-acyltransferase, integral membrane enzyme [Singulisphaera sp. GP187]|uniref:acyltransferase family protein n=1 Tax=Singulisphaera sp. GP187 TaxID=1882752 RepID=UPI00092B0AF3|nr:acyltransferase family protein [Singulisphaera sp. GP187]SIO65327.1 Surface polysaccharide O-acyltransferase, integral membrane enzyme [Singulisphaera sp. GP187]